MEADSAAPALQVIVLVRLLSFVCLCVFVFIFPLLFLFLPYQSIPIFLCAGLLERKTWLALSRRRRHLPTRPMARSCASKQSNPTATKKGCMQLDANGA